MGEAGTRTTNRCVLTEKGDFRADAGCSTLTTLSVMQQVRLAYVIQQQHVVR